MFNINVFVRQCEIHHLQFRTTARIFALSLFLCGASLCVSMGASLARCVFTCVCVCARGCDTSEPYQIGIKANTIIVWVIHILRCGKQPFDELWNRRRIFGGLMIMILCSSLEWEFGELKMAISLEPTSYNITRTPSIPSKRYEQWFSISVYLCITLNYDIFIRLI